VVEQNEGQIKQIKSINLDKDVASAFPYISLGTLFITLFLLLIFGGWYLSSSNVLKKTEEQIGSVNTELSSLKDLDQKTTAFSGAVKNIESVLSQKTRWSPIFKELERVTPKDIVCTSFSVEESKAVLIEGYGPSLGSVAKLLAAFSGSKSFSNPVLTSVNVSDNKAHFSMTVTASLKEGK